MRSPTFDELRTGSSRTIIQSAEADGSTELAEVFADVAEGGKSGTPIPIYGRFPTWIDAGRIAFSGCDGWVGGSRCGIWSIDTGKWIDFRPLQLTENPEDRPTDAYARPFLYASPASGNWDVYVIDTTPPARRSTPKAAPRRLTDDPAQDLGATFSPDGKRVAFMSNRGGAWGIWVMNADGSQPRLLAPAPGGFGPGWAEERLSWGAVTHPSLRKTLTAVPPGGVWMRRRGA